ncbi:MAG: hypothetical protein R3E66_14940 [bacterium]
MDNTQTRKFHFIVECGYPQAMNRHIFVDAIALIYGEGGSTTSYFHAWLRGVSVSPVAVTVPVSALAGSREATLRRSVLEQVGGSTSLKTYEDWLAKDVAPGDVVVQTHSSADGDFAVALRLADRGVRVDAGTHGWLLPIPAVPKDIVAPFSLGLAVLCCKHGVRPGRFVETSNEAVVVGNARLTCDTPVPLPMDAVELRHTNVHGVMISQARTPGTPDDGRAESLLSQGRSFDRWIARHRPMDGLVAFCFSGPSTAAFGQTGAWRASFPNDVRLVDDGLVASTCGWHRFAEDLLSRSGVSPDLRIGHSVGRWAAETHESLDTLRARLTTSPVLAELSGDFPSVRRMYAAQGEVGAATGEGVMWQAWLVLGPQETVRECVQGTPVEVIEHRGPLECVIAGHPDAIDEVMLRLLNSPRMHATQLELDIAFHSRAAIPHEAALAALFAVEALAQTEDVAERVLDAWARGARIFVDMGPRAGFSHWIPRILEDKPHEVIALDPTMQGPPALVDALVRLAAVGCDVSLSAVRSLMTPVEPSRRLPDLGWQDTALAIEDKIAQAHLQFLAAQTSSFMRSWPRITPAWTTCSTPKPCCAVVARS